MSGRVRLTVEQQVVMIAACEEAYLVDVLDEYGMRLHWARTGDRQQSSNLDDDAKRRLVPRFAAVVAKMIDVGWVEIREPHAGVWDDVEPMTTEQVRQTLHDPASWIRAVDGSHRMVMLTATDTWHRLQSSPGV